MAKSQRPVVMYKLSSSVVSPDPGLIREKWWF